MGGLVKNGVGSPFFRGSYTIIGAGLARTRADTPPWPAFGRINLSKQNRLHRHCKVKGRLLPEKLVLDCEIIRTTFPSVQMEIKLKNFLGLDDRKMR
jgi:hypothetical protein